jgi:endo-1,4-beta-xylanase
LAFFLPITTVVAQPARVPSLPPNQVLLNSDLVGFRLAGQSGDAIAKIVSVQGDGFDRAWQVQVSRQPAAEYQVQLVSTVSGKLNPGDVVLLSVWARTSASATPDHQGCIGLVLEQSSDPFDKLFARRFDLGPDWQRLDVAARIKREFGQTDCQIALRLGYFPQTVEIGGITLRRFDSSISLTDLPQTLLTYPGRQPDAPWRIEAEQRIDRLRKSLLTIHVTDANGNPVSNASIQIHELRSTFPFGCVYNDSRFLATADSTDNLAYQNHFAQLFNTGVDEAGMKWPNWEDPAKRQATLHALQWMHDHDIAVRGHCLVWPGWRHLPIDLHTFANDPAALEHRIDDHIRDEAGALAGQVTEWDVVNEPYLNNDLMHILGDHAMTGWYNLVHQADPSAQLYLNETNVPDSPPQDHRYDALYNQLHTLQQQNAPIAGIGMQAHFNDGLTSPTELLSIYDRFATLHLPIRITELDINLTDEQLQADYFRDFLIASFSHANVNGIILWGFWESQHWRPDAALFRKDWSIKLNGQVWKDLVLNKWSTNTQAKTTPTGTYSTRAFLGDYEITITTPKQTRILKISLPQEGHTAEVQLN